MGRQQEEEEEEEEGGGGRGGGGGYRCRWISSANQHPVSIDGLIGVGGGSGVGMGAGCGWRPTDGVEGADAGKSSAVLPLIKSQSIN